MTTFMRREIEEIPQAAARLLEKSGPVLAEAGREIRARDPDFVVTVARGSSDHAATFLKYAVELTAGLAVASIGPSVASIYGAKLRLDRSVCLAISQSGKSPDIVAMAESARKRGALAIALTNTADSPLAGASDFAIDILAGPERSVAATKSFVNSALLVHMLPLLGQRGGLPLDPALESQIAKVTRMTWLRTTLLAREAAPVVGRMTEAGLDPVLMKGAALVFAYGVPPRLRRSSHTLRQLLRMRPN